LLLETDLENLLTIAKSKADATDNTDVGGDGTSKGGDGTLLFL
jgi:hypothetical protein